MWVTRTIKSSLVLFYRLSWFCSSWQLSHTHLLTDPTLILLGWGEELKKKIKKKTFFSGLR